MTLFGAENAWEETEQGFAAWYAAYPRKRERADALRAYRAAIRAGRTAEQLGQARDAYVAELRASGTEAAFIVYPAGFLRRKLDDYLHVEAPVKKVKAGPVCRDHPDERCFYSPGSGWIHAR